MKKDSLKPTELSNTDSLSPKKSKPKAKHRNKRVQQSSQSKTSAPAPFSPQNTPGFTKQQKKKDIENKKKISGDEDYSNQFEIGQVIYRKMQAMINDAKLSDKAWGYKYLEGLLYREIDSYGFENTMKNIGNYSESDVLQKAEIVCYASDRTQVTSALAELTEIIHGTILTAEESKEVSDINEADDYIDPQNNDE